MAVGQPPTVTPIPYLVSQFLGAFLGVLHSLEATAGSELEFVIFGTPPMAMDDERVRPRKG